jgi:hypothetical protein
MRTTDNLKRLFKAIWTGPFSVGPLIQPISVGTSILKILEVAWKLSIAIVFLFVTLIVFLRVWQPIDQAMNPPARSFVRASIAYDDGRASTPPAISFPNGKPMRSPAQPFRCNADYPIRIILHNEGNKPVQDVSFSLEGRVPGTSTNRVEDGSWHQSDAIIGADRYVGECYYFIVEDGFNSADLKYNIDILNASFSY